MTSAYLLVEPRRSTPGLERAGHYLGCAAREGQNKRRRFSQGGNVDGQDIGLRPPAADRGAAVCRGAEFHSIGYVEEKRRRIAAVAPYVAAELALLGVPDDVAGLDHALGAKRALA